MRLRPNPEPFHYSLGRRGEAIGVAFLAKQGYRILETNFRCPIGEIDVIAEKGGRLVFVEIKTRSNARFGAPEESVHRAKQQKLLRLAEWYLKEKKKEGKPVAFHVLAVEWPGIRAASCGAERSDPKNPHIRLIENAFEADGQ